MSFEIQQSYYYPANRIARTTEKRMSAQTLAGAQPIDAVARKRVLKHVTHFKPCRVSYGVKIVWNGHLETVLPSHQAQTAGRGEMGAVDTKIPFCIILPQSFDRCRASQGDKNIRQFVSTWSSQEAGFTPAHRSLYGRAWHLCAWLYQNCVLALLTVATMHWIMVGPYLSTHMECLFRHRQTIIIAVAEALDALEGFRYSVRTFH